MTDEESLRIKYTKPFKRDLNRVSFEIKIAFREARDLFYANPYHPALRNHALTEKYAGFRSIDVTGDYRAVFRIRETKKETVVTFHILGTHQALYGKN
jgi:addiction module RelE/StbE family toxin